MDILWYLIIRNHAYSSYYLLCSYFMFIFCIYIETKRPELRDLCRYVLPLYAAHWWEIGIFLNINQGQLEVIRLNKPANANGCCSALFDKWLQGTDNATWEKMFEAIDLAVVSFSINNVAIADTSK